MGQKMSLQHGNKAILYITVTDFLNKRLFVIKVPFLVIGYKYFFHFFKNFSQSFHFIRYFYNFINFQYFRDFVLWDKFIDCWTVIFIERLFPLERWRRKWQKRAVKFHRFCTLQVCVIFVCYDFLFEFYFDGRFLEIIFVQ